MLRRRPFIDIVVMAASFGLLTGLLEGLGVNGLQLTRKLSWTGLLAASSVNLIWVAPTIYLVPFVALGMFLGVLRRVFPQWISLRLCLFVFSLIGFYDLLSISGRLGQLGIVFLAAGLAFVLSRSLEARAEFSLLSLKRMLPWLVVGSLLAFLATIPGSRWRESTVIAALPPAKSGTPNILVVVVDTLRADHLSAYGYPRETTPNLARLAKQGVLFEEAVAPSSWTLPSHVSILTGRFPHEHGAERTPYDGRYETIGQALQKLGYRTAAFSANREVFNRSWGFDRGFHHFDDELHSVGDAANRTFLGREFYKLVLRQLGFEDLPGRWRAMDETATALRWISRDSTRPFFAFLNYFDVHDPYLPPQPYRRHFSKIPNPGGLINFTVRLDTPKTPELVQSEIDAYDGALLYVDAAIGRLLAGLEERGLSSDTLVVITSDHGESFGEHGLFGHGNALGLEEIRVPLILRWPGRIPSNKRILTPVSNQSLPSTLTDLLPARDATPFPGPSLRELWDPSSAPVDWALPLTELAKLPPNKNWHVPASDGAMKSLISRDWHYIVHEKFGVQLYEWTKDPRELHDLAPSASTQSLQEDFAARLQQTLVHKPLSRCGFGSVARLRPAGPHSGM